ncbi:MAG: 4-hydroxy-tetrahydrodipicolinate synthase [Marinilabiliales bacterium]|nr:MAG: 4-hydroxy-tetrahydrodipicolinate synthase [Marinilabiliales bacterium]
MFSRKVQGTGVALITPFRKEGSIDFNALTKLVEYVTSNGVNYLVLMGTTSENPVLSTDEKSAIVSHILEINNGKLPVILGMGGNNTIDLKNNIAKYDFTGIDGILSVTPYYNKPNQKGLYNHFKVIANECPVPVILYNVPGRTGANLTAETTLKLASDFDNILAVKEASGNLNQIMEIIQNKPKNFTVLSGDDALTLPLISIGVEGVISVAGQAFPKQFTEMINLARKGNFNSAKEIHYQLFELMNALFVEGNPAGVKAALNIMGIVENQVRLPLATVSRATYNIINKLIQENL